MTLKCSLKVTIGLLVLLGCSARATIAAGGHFEVNAAIVESPAGVIGEVVAVECYDRTRLLTVKLELRETVVIIVDQATEMKRVPAGERSIENAVAIDAVKSRQAIAFMREGPTPMELELRLPAK